MPSFYWGRPPLPDLAEYNDHRNYYESVFTLPYAVAGLTMTIIGCVVTPYLVRRFRRLSSPPFVGSATATLVLLLLVGLAADLGDLLGLWNGPRFLLHRYINFYDVAMLSIAFLPASFLSGIVAVVLGSHPSAEQA
jgi:hypothetical protein